MLLVNVALEGFDFVVIFILDMNHYKILTLWGKKEKKFFYDCGGSVGDIRKKKMVEAAMTNNIVKSEIFH